MKKKLGVTDIRAIGFRGMNNLTRSPALLVDKQTGLITPSMILNADVIENELVSRRGYRKVISLTGAHSLWSEGDLMFCVAQGSSTNQALYRLGPQSATEIASLPDVKVPMSYVKVDSAVYLSSKLWKGIYDTQTLLVRDWGIDLPGAPVASLAEGSLVPGHYKLCYAFYRNGLLSGNGPIVDVSWDSGNRGIRMESRPADAVVWITHPNSGDFVLGTVSNEVITELYSVQKLPTESMIPPPLLQWICFAFGRIWGAVGASLYYSEPFRYDLFKASNVFRMTDDITLIAPVDDGIFIGTSKSTIFLDGRDPGKMHIARSVPTGAIPGSLSYGMVAGGGYQVSRKLSQIPTAIWLTEAGIVMGVQGGHVLFLTDGTNRLYPRSNGATFTGPNAGLQQTIATCYGVPVGEDIPADIAFMLSSGKVIDEQADLALEASGGFEVSGKSINNL